MKNCHTILFIIVSWIPLSQASAQSTLPYADYLFQRGEYYRAISAYDQYLFFHATRYQDSSYCTMQILKCYYFGQEYKSAIGFGESYLASCKVGGQPKDDLARYVGLSYLKMGYPKSAMLYFDTTIESPRLKLLNGICHLFLNEWDKANEQFISIGNTSDSTTSASVKDLSRIALNGKTLSARSPAFAGILSTVLPGAGYAYTGNYQTGIFSLALNALLLGSAFELHRNNFKFTGTFIFIVGFGWYIGNIYGSYTSAVKYNESIRQVYIDEALKKFDYLMK